MTIAEVQGSITSKTTDDNGHIASFTFKKGDVVAHLEARLDKSAGKSPALWLTVWNLHSRSARGQEHRDSSPDLQVLLARFGPIDIIATPAKSLDDL